MTRTHHLNDRYVVVLVTCNRAASLRKVLEAVESGDWNFTSFVIVDNNSVDETSTILSRYEHLPRFKVIRSNRNAGHGAALAMALRYLVASEQQPDYVIFLEDDSIPCAELPNVLISRILNSDYHLVSPVGYKVGIGRRTLLQPSANAIIPADFCLFDGAIMRFEVVRFIGLPVEDWFMMVDDYEYCFRIRSAGLKIGVIRNIIHEILHFGGGGGFNRSTLWRGYYQMRNHVFFLKKYFSVFNLLDFLILQIFKRTFAAILAPDSFVRIRLRLLGLWHGLIGRKGQTLDPVTCTFNKAVR